MEVKKIPVAQIKPYWRNPRRNEETIDKLVQSIRDYGYNVPIVVDVKGIIIAGHARYLACLSLNMKELDCVVLDISEKKAREFRIVDNRIGEFSKWDEGQLLLEIREFSDEIDLDKFHFGYSMEDLLARAAGDNYKAPTQEKIDGKSDELECRHSKLSDAALEDKVEVICPSCGESFYVSRKKALAR